MNKIDRNAYPQLNNILWDRADRYIAAEDAFAAYERRWPHVDQEHLRLDELLLIRQLTAEYGNGMFLSV